MGIKRPSARPKNSSEQEKPWEDEVLREMYKERDAYAAELGFDLEKIYADLRRREANSRLLHAKPNATHQRTR